MPNSLFSPETLYVNKYTIPLLAFGTISVPYIIYGLFAETLFRDREDERPFWQRFSPYLITGLTFGAGAAVAGALWRKMFLIRSGLRTLLLIPRTPPAQQRSEPDITIPDSRPRFFA